MIQEYNKIHDYFPIGTRVWCQSEWDGGKWGYGTVSHHKWSNGSPRWIFIEMDDGSLSEYDYRYLDIDDPRNSLVKKAKNQRARS